MSQSIIEYSQKRIGTVWNERDHAYLLHHIRMIDEVVAEMFKRNDKNYGANIKPRAALEARVAGQ